MLVLLEDGDCASLDLCLHGAVGNASTDAAQDAREQQPAKDGGGYAKVKTEFVGKWRQAPLLAIAPQVVGVGRARHEDLKLLAFVGASSGPFLGQYVVGMGKVAEKFKGNRQ